MAFMSMERSTWAFTFGILGTYRHQHAHECCIHLMHTVVFLAVILAYSVPLI
jgi:hypothetical protein